MESRRRLSVTLSGDVSGHYVVVEERPDGSLVIAPDSSSHSDSAARRPTPQVATLLPGLIGPSKNERMSTVDLLEGWGVELRDGERTNEFFVADVDDNRGFVAITSQRFIFVANTGRGLAVVQQHLLSAARNVELVRRGMRHKLRVSWHGAETLIGTPDRKALSRLRHHLEDQAIA